LLRGISIHNFRGIKQFHIEGFNQINVFIGEFGSGKSTILDAVYLLRLGPEREGCLKRVLSRRTGRTPDLRSCWYGYVLEEPVEVRYELESSSYRIQLRVNPNAPDRVVLTTETNGNPVDAEVYWPLSWYTGAVAVGKEGSFAKGTTLLDAEMFRRISESESGMLGPMKERRLDEEFLRILKETFYTLEGFEFLAASPRQKEFRCFVSFKDARVQIDDVSDGVRNGLVILSTAFMLKDTALLLEEPENHMYPKALDKLLKALVQLCKSNRLQLFVTTHRPEVLASLVEHGKELATVFHFSRENGEVRASPILWNDAKILIELGWDVGKLVKGYEKYVVVEGPRDMLVLDRCFKRLKGVSPENIWITILPSRGIDRNVVEVVKAILPTEREIFVLPDLNKKSPAERRKQIVDSLKRMSSEGYEILEREGIVMFSKGTIRTRLKLKNILPLGDPRGLEDIRLKFESFSMDDYLLEIILQNSSIWSSLEIFEEDIARSKQCTNSKSAINMMRLSDEKVERLLQDCSLPKGLVEIIDTIVSGR